MKRVYWRPRRISKGVLLFVGVVGMLGTLAIESFPIERQSSCQTEKLAAAELACRGMAAIREARLQRGHEFDERFDPAGSGMIGEAMSAVTSLPSHLEAKQTSVNPNFAAAVVEMLVDAGVEPGDVVAVGYTGSFPAFNVCVCAALETLDLQPLVIHSAASSQFGANCSDMMWLDMERVLRESGAISFRSCAGTLGGFGDRARGMSDESQGLLRDSLWRNGVPLIEVASLQESIERRMEIYASRAAGRPIKAYINVGGGAASIHGAKGREAFGAGLSKTFTSSGADVDCVASRFASNGVPVIHVGNALQLAERFGLPIAPGELPEVGSGASTPTPRLAAFWPDCCLRRSHCSCGRICGPTSGCESFPGWRRFAWVRYDCRSR
ncbi:MAG: poly-gamma-glutamate system protein [Pirellulales bacterium]